jgi:hypothetical protein
MMMAVVKNGGWSMGTKRKKKGKGKGMAKSDGIFGVCVAVGEIRTIGYKFPVTFLVFFFFIQF